MANKQVMKFENRKPDVAGALQAIRAKKSPEQVKAERLLPFLEVIDEALAHGWKWSPILTLIRERGGPSLTRGEAQRLHAQLKGDAGHHDAAATPEAVGGTPPDETGNGTDDGEIV